MKRFALPDYLLYHEKFQVTNAMMVPPMVVAVFQVAEKDPIFAQRCLRSVKAIVAGAGPLDAVTQRRLQAFLSPDASFTQLWAMTETSCKACYFFYPEKDDTGSVGRFMQNLDVKLVDPKPDSDGREVGPYDTRGELCIRGPTVIKGYLDNPEANMRDWDADGYFHTGDIMYCDSKTKLWYVVDRKKELIKVRGFQVAPNEIEGVLLLHPKVKDAAVIGVPDGKNQSELPMAYIVVAPEQQDQLTDKEVKKWVTDRLARFKELSGGVKFVDSIPKTASGKILKRHLREQAKKESESKARL